MKQVYSKFCSAAAKKRCEKASAAEICRHSISIWSLSGQYKSLRVMYNFRCVLLANIVV